MKKIIGITLMVFLLVSASVASSNKINNSNIKTNNQDGNYKQWTIMIFYASDNDLHGQMTKSIGWLDYNGYNNDIKIVAQLDSNGVERYDITENGAEIVETLAESSTGDKQTIIDFVLWAKNLYPANRYCLVLADHGVGWQNGFLRDDTDKINGKPDYLSMLEFKDCMNTIKKDILGNNKLDLLVLDACQMNMIEVIYQIRGTAKVCLAAPGLIRQNPYHMIFDDVYENVNCNERELAEYFYNARNSYYGYGSMGSYDVEKINSNLIPCLDVFSSELLDNYQRCKNEIKDAVSNTKAYNGEGGYIMHYRDLYSFSDQISEIVTIESVKSQANELKSVLGGCKLYPSGVNGLSIYLPVHNLRYPYDSSYANLDMSKDISWYDFVLKTKNLKNKPVFTMPSNCFRLLKLLELFSPIFYNLKN